MTALYNLNMREAGWMKHPRILLILLVIWFALFALLMVGSWVFVNNTVDEITKHERKVRKGYKAVRPGLSREEVIRRMGPPIREGKEFDLGQYNGNEREYERAANSGSTYYIYWNGGIGEFYVVGFDTNDKVTMKARGGS